MNYLAQHWLRFTDTLILRRADKPEGLGLLANSSRVTARFNACSLPWCSSADPADRLLGQMGSSSSPGISSKKKKKEGRKKTLLMLSSGPPSLLLPATPEILHLYPRDAEVMLIRQTAVGSTLAINQVIREVMDLWYITRAINFRSNSVGEKMLKTYILLLEVEQWKSSSCDLWERRKQCNLQKTQNKHACLQRNKGDFICLWGM